MSNVDKYRDEISTVVLAAQVAGHKTTESRIRDLLERALAEQREGISDHLSATYDKVINLSERMRAEGLERTASRLNTEAVTWKAAADIARTYGQTEGS